ncbi:MULTISPECIES: NAD(P)/FAD-dependent oxidoreductase [Methylobacterium]|uniref:NAD(P)/FAD-dependent oxidoreductase n=1 Tax=Methylobacterium TaxID=407 RepID=UPI000A69C24D|nr:FAD-dependent oxidoreductase [Methylobacterium sp. Leaf104]
MAGPAQVAIVGAGMAGASAARRLHEAGLSVAVFDKGRQPGGRMANRRDRETGLSFDHGAQVMRAHGPAFRRRLDDWKSRGLVAPFDTDGTVTAVPDMTAPVRDLLAGLDVRAGRTVTALARTEHGWRVALAEAEADRVFDAVVLTVPGPQALRLLAASGCALSGVERARYAPCWSLMLACAAEPSVPGDVLRPATGPIAALFREGVKPGRPEAPPAYTIHATPAWSKAHLEETPEAVRASLLAALGELFGGPVTPLQARAHRWRYALVEETCGAPCLYDPVQRLGYAGDGCLGPRIEAAYDSGLALAERLIADLA